MARDPEHGANMLMGWLLDAWEKQWPALSDVSMPKLQGK